MRPSLIYYGFCFLALVAKIYCAATTFGTNDTGLFQLYGEAVYQLGLQQTYESSQHFNHTPLLASVLMGMSWLSQTYALPFPLILRLPGIFADVVSAIVIWKLSRKLWPEHVSWWWCCLFPLSPVAFMISGYHGNFDSVLAMFICLAAYYCVTDKVDLCAIMFGMAVHVKVAPLILTPVFFFFWTARGKGLRFFYVTSGIVMAVWLVPLLRYPYAFLTNVLGYGSYWGVWGLTYWLRETHYEPLHLISFYGLTPIQLRITMALKLVVIIGVLIVAWRRRRCLREEILVTISYVWTVFFVFAPGVLLHYLVWPSGLMLIHARRWFLAISISSSIFIFWCYNVINGGMPWNKGLFRVEVIEEWIAWSNIPWLTFVAFGCASVWQAVRRKPVVEMTPAPQPELSGTAEA